MSKSWCVRSRLFGQSYAAVCVRLSTLGEGEGDKTNGHPSLTCSQRFDYNNSLSLQHTKSSKRLDG